jgi:hypothetical protein
MTAMNQNATRLLKSVARTVLAALSVLSLPALAALTFDPPNPVEGSMVRIDGLSGCRGNPVNVSVTEVHPTTGAEPTSGRLIEIADPGWIAMPLLPCPKNSIMVGPLRQGGYQVRYTFFGTPSSSTTLNVGAAATKPLHGGVPDYTGFWTPESGNMGLSIQRDPASGRMFIAWFTHASAAWQFPNTMPVPSSIWMYVPNIQFSQQFAEQLSGDLYLARNQGSGFPILNNYPPWPTSTDARRVGSFRFEPKADGAAEVVVIFAADASWASLLQTLFPGSIGNELRFTVSRYRF